MGWMTIRLRSQKKLDRLSSDQGNSESFSGLGIFNGPYPPSTMSSNFI